MLTGGHPNSLGRTIEVVNIVLADPAKLSDLYSCYSSSDEIVRLRTSNAIKRISYEKPEWLVPYIDQFLCEVSTINQASAQWTLANLFQTLEGFMSDVQRIKAQNILERNLESYDDWIVLNNTMQTLRKWAERDSGLKERLVPHLERLSNDKRKSVASRAKNLKAVLS